MEIYGKHRKFSKDGYSFVLSDGGEAKEISKEFGETGSRDIIVSEIPNYKSKDEMSHRYKFTVKKVQETPEQRREKMIADGWKEHKPGHWIKVAPNS